MSDHKLAFIFFEIGMIFCVVAMILGPVGVEIWSVACSVVAIILACMGIYLAVCSWNEVPPVRKKTAWLPTVAIRWDKHCWTTALW